MGGSSKAVMSNSYRKTPIIGTTTADSEKKDKQIANRRLRSKVKQLLKLGDYDWLPTIRDVSNVWDFAKDGKRFFKDKKWFRK
jgi:hypothetical protein